MALIHSTHTTGRTGRPKYVPGSLACAASARRILLTPTLFPLSPSLKRVLATPFSRPASSTA